MEKVYSTHKTYTNAQGEPVPSATTVLKLLHKPQLMNWANAMGFRRQKIEDILLERSRLGTNVHAMIEHVLTGKESPLNITHQGDIIQLQQHMDQFNKWRANHELTPVFMEGEFTSQSFGGTIDYYGDFDGKKSILDFKTSKRFYSSMFLQLGAYVILLEEKEYEIEQVGIVRVNAGKVEVKLISRDDITSYMEAFRQLIVLFHSWYDLNLDEGWGNILE